MRILITKPEPQEKQGGMTFALEQVISYLKKNDNLRISCLVYTARNKYMMHTVCRNSTITTFSTVKDAIDFYKPSLVIGVGWHTWSEQAIRIAKRNQCKTIFWEYHPF